MMQAVSSHSERSVHGRLGSEGDLAAPIAPADAVLNLAAFYDPHLTARYVVQPELRDVIALCSTGVVLVSEGYVQNVETQNALTLIRAHWRDYRHMQLVPYQVILDLGGDRVETREDPSAMVNWARQILADAAAGHVSDIHLVMDTAGRRGTLLMRFYGDLREVRQTKLHEAEELASVIYGVMAEEGEGHYNPAAPQKARIGNANGHLPGELHGVRIQSMPLLGGSMMVLRLLPVDVGIVGASLEDRLRALGYEGGQCQSIGELIAFSSGVTVISGPTGSGKSTTLAAILKSIAERQAHRNILTLEDPPEYRIESVRQIPVQGNDWGGYIEDVMRLDPDIVMVGEVRSEAGALGTLQAANTGHLVLTTVHANSAWKILARLEDLCPRPESRALLFDHTVVRGLAAQRLVQRICPQCAVPLAEREEMIPESEWIRLREILGAQRLARARWRGMGCLACNAAGHPLAGLAGRTVVAEVVTTTRELMQIARTEGVRAAEQAWRSQAGVITIGRHWLMKFANGEIEYASRGGLDLVLEEEVGIPSGRTAWLP
ncbi:MAG: GspE/PulE family protein [Gammaproteobacteria bacterium]